MPITLASADDSSTQSIAEEHADTDLLDEVKLVVELGHTTLTLDEVQQLRPGAMVCLDEYLQDPVTIFAGSKLLGRGEILLIEGQLGVRITELYHPPLEG